LGVNVELLSEILKGCSPQDTLKIQWRADLDTVRFQCERGEDRIVEFDLKLMQVESDRMGIPERDYKVVAKLPSSEFQRICYDLQVFGDTMQIKASAEGITFSVQGDVGSGKVLLKPREAGNAAVAVALAVHEPVVSCFALRHLVNVSKAAPLCSSVELRLCPDAPLLVQYALESAAYGHMRFYLAPIFQGRGAEGPYDL
jgi:proliferating cell nuclear antigen